MEIKRAMIRFRLLFVNPYLSPFSPQGAIIGILFIVRCDLAHHRDLLVVSVQGPSRNRKSKRRTDKRKDKLIRRRDKSLAPYGNLNFGPLVA